MSEYTQTEEYAEMLTHLVEEIGVEREEAEVILQDGDLFPLIEAGSMFTFEGEEAVEQWENAAEMLHKLAALAYAEEFFDNPALAQSFLEAAIRAEEMHKRARERVRAEA